MLKAKTLSNNWQREDTLDIISVNERTNERTNEREGEKA
jgi:hypothetical protein